MPKYKVMGLKKQEHRPSDDSPVVEEIIQAESPEKAKEKFEEAHYKYRATVCDPIADDKIGSQSEKVKEKEDGKTDTKPIEESFSKRGPQRTE